MKVGVNGAVRDISDLKVGVSGAVRAVSEAYIGVAGAAKKVWPSFPAPGKALDNYTWDEISQISSANLGESYFSVGDRKQITLNGTVGALTFEDYHTYAYIIGFDHNAAVEGDHRIHFQLAMSALEGGKNICFVDSEYNSYGSSAAFRMNTSNINSGGWKGSYMRNNICGTSKTSTSGRIMGAIPAELRNALKSVTKYTNNSGSRPTSSAVTATTDYFFLLSEYEVFGGITYSNTFEANYQQQYAYYSTGNSQVKYQHNSTGSAAIWWLRSPFASDSHFFANVRAAGTAGSDGAYASLGFAPGFCV